MMKKEKDNIPLPKLSKPAQRALASAGIKTLGHFSAISEKEFMQLHGIGKNTLQTIRAAMAENNLVFSVGKNKK